MGIEFMKANPGASAFDLKLFREEAFLYYGRQNGLSDDIVKQIMARRVLDFAGETKKILENGKFVGLDATIKDMKERNIFKEVRKFKETGEWKHGGRPKQVIMDMYDAQKSVIDVSAKVDVK